MSHSKTYDHDSFNNTHEHLNESDVKNIKPQIT